MKLCITLILNHYHKVEKWFVIHLSDASLSGQAGNSPSTSLRIILQCHKRLSHGQFLKFDFSSNLKLMLYYLGGLIPSSIKTQS